MLGESVQSSRLYFLVEPERDYWVVSTQEGGGWTAPIQYGGRREAIDGAVRLARAEFKATQRPTGVRVRLGPDNWADSHTFGHDSPRRTPPEN